MPPKYSRNNQRFISKQRNQKTKVGPGEFDLEKSRHEVFQVGLKGLSYQDKKMAKRELAIRLGATPKKPRGKNIKKHLEDLRLQKQKEKEEREQLKQMGDFHTKKKNAKPQKKRSLNEVRGMDYQLGKFKNGIQFLSKDDLYRIKRKR